MEPVKDGFRLNSMRGVRLTLILDKGNDAYRIVKINSGPKSYKVRPDQLVEVPKSGLEFLNQNSPTSSAVPSGSGQTRPTKSRRGKRKNRLPSEHANPSEDTSVVDFEREIHALTLRTKIVIPALGETLVDFRAEPATFAALPPRGMELRAPARPLLRTVAGSVRDSADSPSLQTVLSNGCGPYPSDFTFIGKIAIVQRGGCLFTEKARNAEAAGAVALGIVAHDEQLFTMTVGAKPTAITHENPIIVGIPVFLIGANAGSAIVTESFLKHDAGALGESPSEINLRSPHRRGGVDWAGAEIRATLLHKLWNEDDWKQAMHSPTVPVLLQYSGKPITNLRITKGRSWKRPAETMSESSIKAAMSVYRGRNVLHAGQSMACLSHCHSHPRACCGGFF
ncbi:hypothetical protein DFJ73DRAFT_500973 [Zopfochytrium polystomum]|nr:hypothetical protein DFJ73DRAFT_500973 [Zopfochytrium polystomum]